MTRQPPRTQLNNPWAQVTRFCARREPAAHSLAADAKPTDRRTTVAAPDAAIRAYGAPPLVAGAAP